LAPGIYHKLRWKCRCWSKGDAKRLTKIGRKTKRSERRWALAGMRGIAARKQGRSVRQNNQKVVDQGFKKTRDCLKGRGVNATLLNRDREQTILHHLNLQEKAPSNKATRFTGRPNLKPIGQRGQTFSEFMGGSHLYFNYGGGVEGETYSYWNPRVLEANKKKALSAPWKPAKKPQWPAKDETDGTRV